MKLRRRQSSGAFTPKAFKKYYDELSPVEIQQQAEQEVPLNQVFAEWPISNDPAVHIAAIQKLFDSGVTIVNIHSGQPDQQKVIAFYQSSVLPKFASPS